MPTSKVSVIEVVIDLGATDRHDIRACGEEWCSTILRLVREEDHICRIKTSTFHIHGSGCGRKYHVELVRIHDLE